MRPSWRSSMARTRNRQSWLAREPARCRRRTCSSMARSTRWRRALRGEWGDPCRLCRSEYGAKLNCGAQTCASHQGSPARVQRQPQKSRRTLLKSPRGSSVARVSAQKMDYAGLQREATFQRRVLRIEGSQGLQRAVVFLTPATKADASVRRRLLRSVETGGSVDHIVLTGEVQVEQPGRHAPAAKPLLYRTAALTSTRCPTGTSRAPTQGGRCAAGFRHRDDADLWRRG